MAKLLRFPGGKEKPERATIRATDNGEQLDVITEDGERVVAKSRLSGKWHLLRRLHNGHYRSVGET